jgi:hypothetical protein
MRADGFSTMLAKLLFYCNLRPGSGGNPIASISLSLSFQLDLETAIGPLGVVFT